jgi:hypothetical protein
MMMNNGKCATTKLRLRQTGTGGLPYKLCDCEEKIVQKGDDVIAISRGAVHSLRVNDEVWAEYPDVSKEAIDSLFEWLTGMSPNQFDRYYRKIHRHSAATSPEYRGPLSEQLRRALENAIQRCGSPCFTFDFVNNVRVSHESVHEAERIVRDELQSEKTEVVRDGLSNVLYWGLLRNGNKGTRISRFRHNVTSRQLAAASELFRRLEGPGILQLKALRLPEFSALSSLSKLRMFLDPQKYVTIDRKLLKLRECSGRTLFHNLKLWGSIEYIPATMDNQNVYQRWCEFCLRKAKRYFPDKDIRAVELERGILHLVGSNQLDEAAEILATA